MNQCEYGYPDCKNLDIKCHLCSVKGLHYKAPKDIKRSLNSNTAKITKRKGSEFEFRNNKANNNLLNGTTSRQTPNSGAGHIKGDEEISGIINIMEELKEQNKITSKGEKTFSIHKEWLEKLKIEAQAANKEFWYLKFVFSTNDQDVYAILDSEMVMSMVYTMVEDRKKALLAKQEQEIIKKESELLQCQLLTANKEIELLKAQLKYEQSKDKNNHAI